jgi:hypothetical protein
MKTIYVCSPYRGDRKKNLENAAGYARQIIFDGNTPIVPHLFYADVLDDDKENERKIGMNTGLRLMDLCDELWAFGDIISEGMNAEIEYAVSLGIPINYINGEHYGKET